MKIISLLLIASLTMILMANGAAANQFVFTEGASQTLDAGVLSTKITVERQTNLGTPITYPALYYITLSTSSTGGRFYSDAAGTIRIYRVNIANGASNASFYYRDSTGGTPTLKASLTGWTPAITTFSITPNKLVFTEGASQILDAGVLSTKITVERQTGSGTPITSSALYNIILSTSSTGGRFYSNAAGTILITRISIPNGASNASFYYRDSTGGTPTLKASYTGLAPAITTFTISPNKLVFTEGAPQTLDTGEVSQQITIERQTDLGTPITSPAMYNILLSTSSPGGRFYSDSAGTIRIYRVNIANGYSTASFYYRDSTGGTPTLKAAYTGWTPATSTFTIIPPVPNKFIFTAGENQTLDAGEVSQQITIERQTGLGTPITSPAMYYITLSTSSPGGRFYSDAAGTIRIYRVNIANGDSTASFYYRDSTGGTPTLKASYTGWTPATSTFTIIPPVPNKFIFTAGANQTLDAGEVSQQITIERQTGLGTPITSPAIYYITLSTSSPGGRFYSDSAGTIRIYRVNIANGDSTASFYYRDSAGGTPTLQASYAGWTPATSTFTINPPIPNKFVFTAGASQTLVAGKVSTKITVERQTDSGTPITSPAMYYITVSTSSPSGRFYSDSAGTIQINHIDISNGARTSSFYYKDTVDGNPTLNVSYTGWTPATTTFTIGASSAKKLAFIVQPGSTTAGLSINPAVQVEVQDIYGNRVTTSSSPITILIGYNPGGGTLVGGGSLNAVNGVATFSNLSINKDGLGYTLKTSSIGLTGATSSAFNIIPVYTHSITNATVGNTAKDTVTSSSILGTSMTFTWIRPDSSTAQTATRARNVNYVDTYPVDIDGTWNINVKERKSGSIQIGESSTSFSVVAAPEFGKLGALIPLFAIGFIFMNMRKKILKK